MAGMYRILSVGRIGYSAIMGASGRSAGVVTASTKRTPGIGAVTYLSCAVCRWSGPKKGRIGMSELVPSADVVAGLHIAISDWLDLIDPPPADDPRRLAAALLQSRILTDLPLPDPNGVQGWPEALALSNTISRLGRFVGKISLRAEELTDPAKCKEWIGHLAEHLQEWREISDSLVACLQWEAEASEPMSVVKVASRSVRTIGDLLDVYTYGRAQTISGRDAISFAGTNWQGVEAFDHLIALSLQMYPGSDERLALRRAVADVALSCQMHQWEVRRLELAQFLTLLEATKHSGAAEGDAKTDQGGPANSEQQPAHSPDFRSVNWFGADYSFTPNQAAVVKVLWECYQAGTPDVGDSCLLEAVESNSERLDLVFRGHPAWGTMIVSGRTRGTRRLAESKA
jgi:hypothetical protein